MTTKKTFRQQAREWILAIAILILGVFMIVAFAQVLQDPKKGVASSEAAGWMQAMGSVLAIGIAIWLPYKQREQAIEAAKDAEAQQVQHVLRNLLDEMIIVTSGFEEGNGKKLMAVADGQPFHCIVPIMDRPFTIFDASAPKLGIIQNDDLRRHIITAYGSANGFVSSIRLNNALVDRLDEADYLYGVHKDEIHQRLFLVRRQRLVEYACALKISYTKATEKMLIMRAAIESELGTN